MPGDHGHWASSGGGRRGGGVTHACAQLVQRAQDVGVAPQQARHQDAEHENHERRDNDQREHAASFTCPPQYSSAAGHRRGLNAGARREFLGHTPVCAGRRSVPARARAASGALHGDFGGRPCGRAGSHFRAQAARCVGGPCTPHRRDAGGTSGLGVRRCAVHPGGDECGGGAATGDVRPRAVPVRPDAPGLLRRRRPGARHGHQRSLGVGELPVHDHRLLWPGLLRRPGPRPGPGLCEGLERLALRGVVLAASPAHRPPRDHLPGRPRPRRGRDPPQRRTGLHLCDLPGAAPRNRSAVVVGPGPLGPDHGGRGRHRHRRLAARRELGPDPGTAGSGHGRPAARCHAVRPALAHRLRRVAVVGLCPPPADAQDRHERGRDRLGGHAARPAREHRRPLPLRAGLGGTAGRRPATQFLVLHH